MRRLLMVMAVAIGIVSIMLTARYGWKQADEEIDRWIAAIMFGAVSLCAFVFDALAVRLWFVGWRRTGAFIGVIAGLAFIVTFSNSLGGIVSRSDTVQAQRQSIADTLADNRRELARLEQVLKDLGRYTPADEDAVKAVKRAADTATENRKAECDKRGPNCRQRELDEAEAASKLAATTAAKATTDAAKRYETAIEVVKKKLAINSGEAIGQANPLGNALALIIGSPADVLTARMQAIIALVFELCLVGLMIGVEALGHVPASSSPCEDVARVTDDRLHLDPEVKLAVPSRPKLVATTAAQSTGSVGKIMTVTLEPAAGKRVELEEAFGAYAASCKAEGKPIVPPAQFVDPLSKFCKAACISIKKENGHVYLMNVRLVGGPRAIGTAARSAWSARFSSVRGAP